METPHLDALIEALVVCSGGAPDHDNPMVDRLLRKLDVPAYAFDLIAEYGGDQGLWGEHPPLESGRPILAEDWQEQVMSNQTRLGYWEWVSRQLDEEDDESEQP